MDFDKDGNLIVADYAKGLLSIDNLPGFPDGIDFAKSTSAEQVGDWLYIGSLTEPNWGRIRISSLP